MCKFCLGNVNYIRIDSIKVILPCWIWINFTKKKRNCKFKLFPQFIHGDENNEIHYKYGDLVEDFGDLLKTIRNIYNYKMNFYEYVNSEWIRGSFHVHEIEPKMFANIPSVRRA